MPEELRDPLSLANIPARREVLLRMLGSDEAIEVRRDRVESEDLIVPGPKGSPELSMLIVRPRRQDGPFPCVYHIHGGGLVLGNRRVGIATMLEWMDEVDLTVVSVEYRLAPEHPYPAAIEDCYAGLQWTAEHATDLDIDSGLLLVAGASAGGGLAAALALLARDRGGPAIAHQILMCPMLDDRLDTQSSRDCDHTGSWERASSITAWTALLGPARGTSAVSPYAAAARATDLRGLPPAFVDVGTAEILRDEDIDFARRLLQDGVPVELHVWPGGFHGFDVHVPHAALSRMCKEARIDYLKRVLPQSSPVRTEGAAE
jgi:acetyl esterase/lipase